MFDKRKALTCAILFYVFAAFFAVLYIVLKVKLERNIIPLIAVAVPMFLVGAVVMTIVFFKLNKRRTIGEMIAEKKKLAVKYNSGNPTGIAIETTKDGAPIFVGTFDLGELGTVKGENVDLHFETAILNEDAKEYARKTVELIQAKLVKYSHNLLNYFLLQALYEAYDACNEVWKHYRKCEDKYTDEQCLEIFDKIIENEFNLEAEQKAYDQKGLTAKFDIDIVRFIKEKFEFFDVDKLIESLTVEDLNIDGSGAFSIQISDKTNEIFCGAYEEFETDLTPQEWNNF